MKALELKVPPVVVAAICAGLSWGLARALPALIVALPLRRTLAVAFVVLGVGVALSGVLAFRRSRTTVDPTRPEKASSLVTSGVYRVTRNPMYLGIALALVGWAVWLAHTLGLIGVVVFVAYLTRFQIMPEERALRRLFGEEFDGYVRHVRRWV